MASSCARQHRCLGAAWLLFILFINLFAAALVEAANRRWSNTFGGAFNVAANWTGGVPGNGDVAEFGVATLFTPGTYTVTFDVSPTNQGLRIEDDFVTFDLNGRTYNTTLDSEIGNLAGASGQLTITDGTWSFATNPVRLIEIGATANATGTLIVSTGGSITGLPPHVLVGSDGIGTLTVENSGDISAMTTRVGWTSAGTATITGAGSTLINALDLVVGNLGSGAMTISAGGVVQSNGGGVASGGVTGTVTVTDFNSRWNNLGELTIGSVGVGQLSVMNGGRVDDTNGYIGFHTGSTGTVTMGQPVFGSAASQWVNSGTLTVGNAGNGTLNLLPNGRVQNTDAFIGRLAGGAGEVNLSAPDAQWLNTGDLTVGDSGDGTLNISNGGYVQNVDGTVAAASGSTGTVEISGLEGLQSWRNTGVLTVGLGGHGTLSITDGGLVHADMAVFIGQNLGSMGEVTVDGDGSELSSSAGMQIGNSGQATLTVANGGSLSSTFAEIGGLVGITSTVTIDGAGSRWNTTGLIEVGDSGDATLTISDGGVAKSSDGALADAADAVALVTVTGAGSTWEMTGVGATLYVGEDGAGTLNIFDGGAVSDVDAHIAFDLDSTGGAFVSGAGSTWSNSRDLNVGTEGNGELTIENGGAVSDRDGYIGREVGATGVVTVTGANSTWNNSSGIGVGYFGEGSLMIKDGGNVTGDFGFIGTFENSTGAAVVTGAGSTWSNEIVVIGNFGNGTIIVEDGGTVSTARGFIASGPDAIGAATITGAGSAWSTTEVFVVGFQGTAQLSITGGGSVVSNDAWIAGANTSNGTVTVAGVGSNWTIAGRLAISEAFDPDELPGGGTGTLSIQPGGTVTVAGETALVPGATVSLEGGTLDTGSVSFTGGGTFNFLSGTLHVGAFGANLVNQGGTLAPGHSAGSTTINGLYAQQPAGTLEIEIGGIVAGSTYDFVSIANLAAISGQLQLGLLDGFVPAASDTFTVLTAATGIFGAFSNVANGARLATFDDLGSFQVNYGPGSAFNPNHIVLSNFIPNTLPGDFNDDGIVDAADFVMWRKLNSNSATYATWRQHFRESLPGAGSSFSGDATPEPTSLVLLAIAAVAPLRRRRWTAVRGRC